MTDRKSSREPQNEVGTKVGIAFPPLSECEFDAASDTEEEYIDADPEHQLQQQLCRKQGSVHGRAKYREQLGMADHGSARRTPAAFVPESGWDEPVFGHGGQGDSDFHVPGRQLGEQLADHVGLDQHGARRSVRLLRGVLRPGEPSVPCPGQWKLAPWLPAWC